MDPRRDRHRVGAVFLDGTIVNVALPRIGRELPALSVGVLEGQTYIVSGYLAVLAALLILAGALSDHYGRRRVYAIGLASFASTSALCGLAPTMEWLVLFRLLQGAAGALLVPGSLSLITQTFERRRSAAARSGSGRPRRPALTLLGPLVGGLLVDTVGWRFAFLVNVPVLAVRAVGDAAPRRRSRATRGARSASTGSGSFVAALAVGGLSFGLIRGGEQRVAGPGRLGRARRSGSSRSSRSRSSWPAAAPARAARRSSGRGRSRRSTSRRSSSTARLYVTLSYQGLVLQGVLGYTALGGRRRRPADRALPDTALDPGRHARRPGRGPPVPVAGPV